MPPQNDPPTPDNEPSDEDSAEAFANDYAEFRAQHDEDHTLLHQMATALDNFLGLQDVNKDDEQPELEQPEPRRQTRPQTRQSPRRGTPSPENPADLPRVPDQPPEENHWYWRKRFNVGRGK